MFKGGTWYTNESILRSAERYILLSPGRPNRGIGFRLAFKNINKSPVDLNSTAPLTIAENQPVDTIVGEFNATDPEVGVLTYHFVTGENNN